LVLAAPLLLSCCLIPFACSGPRSSVSPNQTVGNGRQNGETTVTLHLQFSREQTRFDGMEVFLDGKVVKQSVSPFDKRLTLQVPPGDHSVAIRVGGKEVFPARRVQVKPADQGVTTLDVPVLADPGEQGTLLIDIKSSDPAPAKNLEMFVDGRSRFTFQFAFQLENFTLNLPPGPHTVALRKNGIEVFSEQVEVKTLAAGKPFLKIDLVVTGTVEIRNARPIGVGVEAYVDVDGADAKRWPVGSANIQVKPEVGRRVIRVYTKRPVDMVIETFNVDVQPGKEVVLRMMK
jgi:hypothetical protein